MFQFPFHRPFRSGRPVRDLGDIWDVAIDGRPFRVDRTHEAFQQGIQSLPLLRQQSDQATTPGEGSINREDLWRKSQSSWHHGAGQRYLDKEESDPERFWTSQGVDVWTRDELRLLKDTELSHASLSDNPQMLVLGDFIYLAVGTTTYRYNGSTWSEQAFPTNTGQVTSLATNGREVFAVTPSKAYRTNTSTTTWSDWLAQQSVGWDLVGFARNRIVAAYGNKIAEITGSTATTISVLNNDEANADRKWIAIAEGNTAIYAASVFGDRSQIFRLAPAQETPTGVLAAPIPAAPMLPTGEVVTSLYGYLGQVVIGTNKGVRVAEEDNNGNLVIGALIETSAPVRALNGTGSFVDFGWTNYTNTTSGLGRINLSQLITEGVYAYASDIMATTQGSITSVIEYKGRRYFGVSGEGIYAETDDNVASGWLKTGLIRYGIADNKLAHHVELRHARLSGSVSVELAADQGDFIELGTNSLEGTVVPTTAFKADNATNGTAFELQVDLQNGVSGSPVIQHLELRSAVVPLRGETFLIPVLLYEDDTIWQARHPFDDFRALRTLANSRRSITYQERSLALDAIVQDYQFARRSTTQDGRWWNGTMVLKIFIPAA